MNNTAPVIIKVRVQKYPEIEIEASDGKIYYSDLSIFSKVYCFPKNQKEWENVSIDSYGLGLIWSSRFEVHVDQLIGTAVNVKNQPYEKIKK